jgi:hypothetical protein
MVGRSVNRPATPPVTMLLGTLGCGIVTPKMFQTTPADATLSSV